MQTPEIVQEIKELLSPKQKKVDFENLHKMDLEDSAALLFYFENLKNVLTLNKIAKEYKKITGRGESAILRVVISFAISIGFSLSLFYYAKEENKDVMQYVFVVFNFFLLLSMTLSSSLRDYYDDVRKMLITRLKEENYYAFDDKIIISMMQKIKTEYQKEEILKNIPENKNTEVVSIKRKRI